MICDVERFEDTEYSVVDDPVSHLQQIETNLVQQFKFECHPNIESLMKIVSTELEKISTDVQDIQTKIWLDTAEGAQLDMLGVLLRRARRPGYDDDQYRFDLETQVLLLTNDATLERVLCILSREIGHHDTITDKDVQVVMSGYGSATVFFRDIDDVKLISPQNTFNAGLQYCDALLAAGIGADVRVLDEDCPIAFSFDDNDGNGEALDEGFGSDITDDVDEGCFVGLLVPNPNLDVEGVFTLDDEGLDWGFGSDITDDPDEGRFLGSFRERYDPCEIENPYVDK
tara:strand:+ start:47885 stop:48739 length:855 start_codon:yes stop_codon:yes gene_type:complete